MKPEAPKSLRMAGEIEAATAQSLAMLVALQPGAIVSRALVQRAAGSMTHFAFDAGQALSEHTSPFDAYAQILEGTFDITIAGKLVAANSGDIVRMPANIPHAVDARTPSKMLLLLFRG